MKRRGFFRALLGLSVAPVVAKTLDAPQFRFTQVEVPLTIDDLSVLNTVTRRYQDAQKSMHRALTDNFFRESPFMFRVRNKDAHFIGPYMKKPGGNWQRYRSTL